MLDDEEFQVAYDLFAECMRSSAATMDDCFRPVLDYYFEITGDRIGNPNAVLHYRITLYGPPCTNCGKPYRTPKSYFCAVCGHVRGAAKRF